MRKRSKEVKGNRGREWKIKPPSKKILATSLPWCEGFDIDVGALRSAFRGGGVDAPAGLLGGGLPSIYL